MERKQETKGKDCVIRHVPGSLTHYDFINKILSISSTDWTVFDSMHKAHSALHHAVENDKENGISEPWKNYEILKISEGR